MTTDDATRHFVDDFAPEDDIVQAARQRGDEVGVRSPSPSTGATLQWLCALIGAGNVVEIGTGAGVSGLWLLKGMVDVGVLTTVDEEAEHTRIARQAFSDAGVPTQRTRLITGRPLDVMARLADAAYDVVFCAGDPREYAQYFDEAVRLLRVGGLVIFDNALAEGRVGDPAQRDPMTVAVRTLVTGMAQEERAKAVLLPVGDGLLAAQKTDVAEAEISEG